LIVGLVADDRGLVPEPDAERWAAWGDAIRRTFSNCIGRTPGEGSEVEMELDAPTTFDHIVLQEDIRNGERVRKYAVHILRDDTWKPLARDTCIAH
jgi:alpha-L-fucosidase